DQLLADDHLAVPGVVAPLAGGDLERLDHLAVAPDDHLVGLGVDGGDLTTADGEAHGLGLLAIDAGAALDTVEGQLHGDLGAGLPVLLGPEVEAVVAEPVTADLDRRLGLDGDGLLDVLRVRDAPGEAERERHADADSRAVLR